METQAETAYDYARGYLAAGYSVIPVRCDGSKAAAIQWKEYTERRASEEELARWFSPGGRDAGIALVCGKVSGGLECLDFDDPSYYPIWCQLVEQEGLEGLLGELPVQKTPTGLHVLWGTDTPEGSQKLAVKADDSVAIETRGEGAYFIAVGSPHAVHETGEPYQIRRHGLFFTAESGERGFVIGATSRYLPDVSAVERETLLKCARALTEREEKGTRICTFPPTGATADLSKSGADYNARADWDTILKEQGWRFCGIVGGTREDSPGVVYLTRPGKERGVSASLGKCVGEDGEPKLYVFSTNAAPLEAGCSYSKFAVYAAYEHESNYSAAAKALASEGYGEVRHSHETFQAISKRCAELWQLEQLNTRPEQPSALGLLRSNNGKFRAVFNATDLDHDKQVGSILAHCARGGLSVRDTCDVLYLCPSLGRRAFDDLEALSRRMAWHVYESNLTQTPEDSLREEERDRFRDSSEEQRVDQIRNRLGCQEFKRLVQYGKDRPHWAMRLESGAEVSLGTTARLMARAGSQVSESLFNEVGILLERVKQPEWDLTVLMMREHAYGFVDNELDWHQLVPDWIRDCCELEADEGDVDDAIKTKQDFCSGEKFHVRRDSLCDVARRFDSTITQPELCSQLRQLGFEPKQLRRGSVAVRYWIGLLRRA